MLPVFLGPLIELKAGNAIRNIRRTDVENSHSPIRVNSTPQILRIGLRKSG